MTIGANDKPKKPGSLPQPVRIRCHIPHGTHAQNRRLDHNPPLVYLAIRVRPGHANAARDDPCNARELDPVGVAVTLERALAAVDGGPRPGRGAVFGGRPGSIVRPRPEKVAEERALSQPGEVPVAQGALESRREARHGREPVGALGQRPEAVVLHEEVPELARRAGSDP